MIESAALRKFALSYFLMHPTCPLIFLVSRIARKIQEKFFEREIVFIKDKELTGCILQCKPEGYLVEIYDDNQAVPQKEIMPRESLLRKDSATKNEVLHFLMSVTKETPLGRIILGNVMQEMGMLSKSRTPPEETERKRNANSINNENNSDAKSKWRGQVIERRNKEAEEEEERREEEIEKKVLDVQRKEWYILNGQFSINKHILSVYSTIHVFSAFFRIENISLNTFTDVLLGKEGSEVFAAELFSKLLKSVSHERRKSSKEGLKEIIQVAIKTIYENPLYNPLIEKIEDVELVEEPEFTRIQWFVGDATQKTWRVYMRSFIYDIVYTHKIRIKTVEFLPQIKTPIVQEQESKIADRVLMLSFLLEICMIGIRFRVYLDNAIETLKIKEKERQSLVTEIKKLKDDLSVANIAEKVGLLKKTEKELSEIDAEYAPEILRSVIGRYRDIIFLMIGKTLFYYYKNEIFQIDRPDWSTLLSLFAEDKKKDASLLDSLKRYMRLV